MKQVSSWLKFALAASFFAIAADMAHAQADEPARYREHCVACHGEQRLGGMGPALLPESLERLRRPAAVQGIGQGRVATQMPGFADKLGAEDIRQLTEFLYSSPGRVPEWGEAEIRGSRVEHAPGRPHSARPVFAADPMNLFVVILIVDTCLRFNSFYNTRKVFLFIFIKFFSECE